jgi:hypothetical protein
MERDEVLEGQKLAFEGWKVADLSGSDVLRFLRASDVDVTWLRSYESGRIWALVIKPLNRGSWMDLG